MKELTSVFLPGWYGRPCVMEQDIVRKEKRGKIRVRRWPNYDKWDPLLDRKIQPDPDPWEGTKGKLDDASNDKYYDQMHVVIAAEKPSLIVTSFIFDAAHGGLIERHSEGASQVFCVEKEAARLEHDRQYQYGVMGKHGVDQPKKEYAETLEAAEEIVIDFEKGCVLKSVRGNDKSVEICYSSSEALSAVRNWPKDAFPMVVEERLVGIEIAYAGFVDYRRAECFIPMVTDLESTKLCAGDIGPETSEMGIHDVRGVPERIIRDVFRPLYPWFREQKYVGWFDVSGIFDPISRRYRVFECMTRLGSSQLDNVCGMLKSTFVRLVWDLVHGELEPEKIEWKYDHGVTVVMVCSGYPHHDAYMHGEPVLGDWRELLRGVEMPRRMGGECFGILNRQQTICEKMDRLVAVGQRHLNATGLGQSAFDAMLAAYSVLDSVRIHDAFYRNDIGKRYQVHFGALASAEMLPAGAGEH